MSRMFTNTHVHLPDDVEVNVKEYADYATLTFVDVSHEQSVTLFFNSREPAEKLFDAADKIADGFRRLASGGTFRFAKEEDE